MVKKVKKAYTIQCKDAVTKEALEAVLSVSHNASYKNISIHNVKSAGVLKAHTGSIVYTGKGCSSVSCQEAVTGHVHMDMPVYKSASYNLTIDELFGSTRRNFV